MKNADMPAMPIVDADGTPMSHGELNDWSDNSCLGLTKREEFAKFFMASLTSTYWESYQEYECGSSLIKCQAETAIEMADALFAALERTK